MVGYFRYPNKPFNLTELARPPWSSKSINPKTKMKNFVLTFLSCTLFTTMLIAQADCEPYLPTEEGTSWELTHYSAKGKVSGVMQYELLEKTVDGDDMTFKVKATTFDKNEEEVYTSDFEAFCKAGEFSYDMTFMMDGAAMEAYSEMDVEVDGGEFSLPDLDAPAGTTLPDGHLDIRVGAGGGININMAIDITDRKIEGREEITTPAGTFNCVVLSQTTSTKTIMRVETSSKDWYAPGVGVVRSESYNRKGKLTGYSELTALDQ